MDFEAFQKAFADTRNERLVGFAKSKQSFKLPGMDVELHFTKVTDHDNLRITSLKRPDDVSGNAFYLASRAKKADGQKWMFDGLNEVIGAAKLLMSIESEYINWLVNKVLDDVDGAKDAQKRFDAMVGNSEKTESS